MVDFFGDMLNDILLVFDDVAVFSPKSIYRRLFLNDYFMKLLYIFFNLCKSVLIVFLCFLVSSFRTPAMTVPVVLLRKLPVRSVLCCTRSVVEDEPVAR